MLQAEGAAGGFDAALQEWGFHHQLPRLHPEALGQGREDPLTDGHQQGRAGQGQQGAAPQPAPGQGNQQGEGRQQQQHGEQQPQRQPHMQIHEARPRGHAAALHHQIKGGQGVAQGHHNGQCRHLGLQHPLLGLTEAIKVKIRQAAALADGEQQAGRQPHKPLGEDHAQHEPQGRQAQHGEGQIKTGEGIAFAEWCGQQGWQPQAPATCHRRGRARQGGRQGDPQGGVGPEQQWQQQAPRQARHQQGR